MPRKKSKQREEDPDFLVEMLSGVDTPESSSDSDVPGCSHDVVPSTTIVSGISASSSSSSHEEESEQEFERIFLKRSAVTRVPIFSLQKGTVQSHFSGKSTPTDIFLTVVDDNILGDIVYQSNLYIQQHQRRVKPITTEEMYDFLGIQFLFGYHHLLQSRQYWSNDPDLSVPIVPQAMTRN